MSADILPERWYPAAGVVGRPLGADLDHHPRLLWLDVRREPDKLGTIVHRLQPCAPAEVFEPERSSNTIGRRCLQVWRQVSHTEQNDGYTEDGADDIADTRAELPQDPRCSLSSHVVFLLSGLTPAERAGVGCGSRRCMTEIVSIG